MIPKSEVLPCGHRIVPYMYNRKINMEISTWDRTICEAALAMMQMERKSHRLADNYTYEQLRLSKMFLYNFVFYKDTFEPICCSGSQVVNDNTIRVFSRYFSFDKYKTDGTELLNKVDNFDELKYSLEYLNHKLIFWSRDKSPKFFERLKDGRPDIFSKWKVHPNKLEIIYPNNNQYVFYTGDVNEILY
mgnify:FL=1